MEKDKIYKYHFEEIVFILLILASELSKYNKDELDSFNEAIEGRIEVLFNRDFLLNLGEKYGITDNVISELEDLKELVVSLYESQWMKKLLRKTKQIEMIRSIANGILKTLRIESTDPKRFSDEHLTIDW